MSEVLPSHICIELMSSKKSLAPKFKTLLNCSEDDLKKIKFAPLKRVYISKITDRIKYLLEMDVNQQSIIHNTFLLVMHIGKVFRCVGQ
jgi:hypothetical protein